MPQLSERDGQLPFLVEAGEILQKLKPMRIATLLYISDDEVETQTEIADILGISRATVTTHLQLLADFPRPLTVREQEYRITSDGDAVIGFLDAMFRHLGLDLSAVDLSDKNVREEMDERLFPLHKTRSITPFLILYSLGQRSAVEERLDRFVSPSPVQLKNVLKDVKEWQERRGNTANRKQVRAMLNRFEEAGVIEWSDDEITLTDKGQEHVRLLEQVTDLFEEGDFDESEASSTTSGQVTNSRSRPLNRTDTGGTGLPVSQRVESEEVDKSDSPSPALVPAYTLSPSDSETEETDSQSSPLVLALTPTARVDDLADQIERVSQKYGNAQLELVWTNLRSEVSEDETSTDSRLRPR